MACLRIYLDTRRKLKSGEYPIKIVIYHIKDVMISTGFTAKGKEFNGEYLRSSANHSAKNANLNRFKNKIERKLLDLERDGILENLSDRDLKRMLTFESIDFFSIFEEFIDTRETDKTKEIRWCPSDHVTYHN